MSEIKKSHLKKTNIDIKAIILIISDSLSKIENWRESDKSGKLAEQILIENGIKIEEIQPIPDDKEVIQNEVQKWLDLRTINLILTIGGTGIAKRDVTIEAVKDLIEKELLGFGELFRSETNKELGTLSIMTRCLAGVVDQSVLCCLPGSPNAVKLGISILLQELLHILNLRLK